MIKGVVGRCGSQVGAFPESIYHRLSRDDAVCFGGNGLCQYHTVTFAQVSAYNGRNQAQIRLAAGFKLLQRSPA